MRIQHSPTRQSRSTDVLCGAARSISALLLAMTVFSVHAQVVGDFRSHQSGEWNTPDTWEQWTGSQWVTENPQYSPGSVVAPSDGFPIIAGTSTSSKTNTTNAAHTIDLPSGIVSGDLLLIFWADANNSATEPTLSGWTELATSNSSTSTVYRKIWYRVADGSEGSTMSTNAFGDRSAHAVYRIAAGSYSGTPYASAADNGTDATPNPANLNPGIGSQKFLWIASFHAAEVQGVTVPTGYSDDLGTATSGNTNSSTNCQVMTAQRKLETNQQDPALFTIGNNCTHTAWTVAVQGATMDLTYPNPVVVATDNGVQSASNVTSHSISVPAGAVGDLLVTIFSVDGNPTVTTASSGWTKLDQSSYGTTVTGAIFWKMATGTTPAADALSLTTSASERSSHVTYRIRGATGISGSETTGSSSNSNPPNHTAGEASFLWIATRSGDDTDVASAAPTNYGDMITVGAGSGTGASTNTATRVLGAAANSENPGSFASANEQWVSYTLAIQGPAPNVTYIPIDPPAQASGNGYPSVASSTSSAKTSASGTTHTVSLPTGIQNGDLLLVFWVDANTASTVSLPGGWTGLYDMVGTANQRRVAAYRVADGSEGSTVNFTTSAAERSAHTAYRIAKGSYTGVPTAGTTISNISTTIDPPSNTSGFGNVPTLWIAAAHISGIASSTAPASYGDLLEGYTGSTGTDHARMATSLRELQAASEDPGTIALGSSQTWGANTVAIQGVARSFSTVRNGHTVTVNSASSVDDLTVEAGGTVAITSNNLTVNGTSLVLDGSITGVSGAPLVLGNTSGKALTVTGSGSMQVYDLTANTAGGVTMNPAVGIRGTLQLNTGAFTAVGAVSLVSDATGTGRLGPVGAGASYVGNLTVNRHIPAGATNWRMMGSPVAGRTVNDWKDDFYTAGFPGSHSPSFSNPVGSGILWPSVRWYDETNAGPAVNDGLTGATSTAQTLAAGQGFAAWCGTGYSTTTAFTVDVTGNPHVALTPIALPMSYTNTGVPATDGWNMVSNPLASPIAFDQIARGADVADYVTYFNPAAGNLATWDIGDNMGTNGGTNIIQSSQAFWLKATGPAVTTTVSESAKVAGNTGGFFGGAEVQVANMVRLRIESAINQYSDETVVLFSSGEPAYNSSDVPKFIFAHPDAPQIASMGDGGEMIAINAYGPYNEDISIPVTVDVALNGQYSIVATGLHNIGLSCVRLEDLATG
ncbi:MAG TPA: hypothetical protein PKJ19_08455, partial [Flavobacteriales bacterium]|nr:hypothetical protein [Flavobacteriales bacterium]